MHRSDWPRTGPVVLMDAGSLLADHGPVTPEGLPRVELAYATWLLASDLEVIWLRWDDTRRDLVVVPEDDARRRIGAVTAQWAGRRGRVGGADGPKQGLRSWLRHHEARLAARSPVVHAAGRLARELRLAAHRTRWGRPRWWSLRTPTARGQRPAAATSLSHLLSRDLALQRRDLLYLDVAYHDRRRNCPGMAALERHPRTRRTYFVHDLIPLDAPELVEADGEERFRSMLRCMLERDAVTVVVNSRYTADRLVNWCDRWERPRPQIVVNPLGTDLIDDDRPQPAGTPKPTASFVTVGTIGPRKNHSLLLHLWRLMLDEGVEPPTLHIVGRRWGTPGMGDVQRILDHPGRLAPYVIEHTDLPDDHLRELLVSSRALLLPSWTEGWGMPLAEALALGVPAICSDIPPFREVGGAVPRYVSPLDGVGWQAAVSAYRDPDDPDRQRQLAMLAAGEHRIHHWSEHFARLDDAVLRVTGR